MNNMIDESDYDFPVMKICRSKKADFNINIDEDEEDEF